MKKTILLFIWTILLFSGVASASNVEFVWTANSELNLAGYRIFVRYIFEEYDANPSWEGNDISCQVEIPGNGVFFAVIKSYNSEGLESDASNEVRFEWSGSNIVYGDVSCQSKDNGVLFSLPNVSEIGVAGYFIYYTHDSITEVADAGSVNEYFLELEDGVYQFDIVPYNDVGDEYIHFVEAKNYLWPPIDKPQLKVESVGIGLDTLVLAGISPPEDDRVDYHYYYMASSHEKIINGDYDICNGEVTGDGNILENVSSLNGDYNMVFIKVVPVNAETGVEGEAEIAYVLFGNIVGTYNEGVAWDKSDVYYMDFGVFGQFYGKPTERLSSGEYFDVSLWDELPFSYAERSDFSGNKLVYVEDYSYLGQKYGHLGTKYQ